MIALLQMELSTEAEDVLSSLEADEADSHPESDPLSLTESNSPCLDILLSENIPAHILAASRMPVRFYLIDFKINIARYFGHASFPV
jgi:hypothetical protein